MMVRYGLTILVCMSLAGCAEKSSEITASYVSPNEYNGYSCSQIGEEARRVSTKAGQVMSAQDKKASNDAGAMAVGMILFWPALFFIKGDAETAAEVGRLKGEMEALEQASIKKRCGIEFRKAETKTQDT